MNYRYNFVRSYRTTIFLSYFFNKCFRRERENHIAGSMEEQLENDNETRLTIIAEKVKRIKGVAYDMGTFIS